MTANFIDYEELGNKVSLLAAKWTHSILLLCVNGDRYHEPLLDAVEKNQPLILFNESKVYVRNDVWTPMPQTVNKTLFHLVWDFSVGADVPFFMVNLLETVSTETLTKHFVVFCGNYRAPQSTNPSYANQLQGINAVIQKYNKTSEIPASLNAGSQIAHLFKNMLLDKDEFDDIVKQVAGYHTDLANSWASQKKEFLSARLMDTLPSGRSKHKM